MIGTKITFDCQPYHRGTMVIEKAIPLEQGPATGPDAYRLEGTATWSETSRLGGHSISREHSGQFAIPRAYARSIEQGHVIYVYPV